MNKTFTKKEDIVEDIHGLKISDPYRWLEDETNPEVQTWINEQNKVTTKKLETTNFHLFSEELCESFKVVNFSNPIPVRGKYFYTERQTTEDQTVLYVKKGLNGESKKLVDPNILNNNHTSSLDYWFISKTGKYIAYGISQGGDEMATLYIKDTESNLDLPEKIEHCRHSLIRWFPDDSAFFYTRNPHPGTVPKNEEHLHTKVYLHKIGSDPKDDELIFGTNRPKDDLLGLTLSPDGRYLAIRASQEWSENDIFVYDQKTKHTTPLVMGISATFSLRFLTDKVLIYTNYKANNERILQSSYNNFNRQIDDWEELIPEQKFLMESIHITKSKILIEYLVNACSKVETYNYQGQKTGEIPLPKYASLSGISASIEEEEFFYGVESFVFPKIVYRYDKEGDKYMLYQKTNNPIKPDDYEVSQHWYSSNDGTTIPMFIFHKKDVVLNGENPTILYGYGGFGHNQTPGFMRTWIPWIKRGGIFAIANVRGGGEFGKQWHQLGIKKNKQNSFTDFIGAAEYLIAKKFTTKNQLGITGTSNGGLLVSAVGIQRPDLFEAVCPRVPLTDMVRFPKFGIAVRWIHEYGNPENKTDLEDILKWSPYHNSKQGIKYPNFLFTTADKDTRVNPLHARKMAAQLQAIEQENETLIYTETDVGHGKGKPVKKIVAIQALVLSFFAGKLGLKN